MASVLAGRVALSRICGIRPAQLSRMSHICGIRPVSVMLAAINDEKLSLRQATSMCGIPKSTLVLYKSGKAQIGMKPGQSPVI